MWLLISSILGCCLQDAILVIPPYPYCSEEVPQDVPLEDCWYARPQLLFTCYLRPKHGRAPKNPNYRYGPDDIHKHLVFFSTFEELKLPISGPMERAGVTKLYEPSPTPCLSGSGCGDLHVASSAWVVCQLRRLMTGRMLPKRYGLSAELRLAGVARLIGTDWK